MKRLTTTIVGLSLFVAGALSAQDKFAGFYPTEDIDTPSYLISNDIGDGHSVLAQSSLNDSTVASIFPSEDLDTPEFLRSNDIGEGHSVLAKSSLEGERFASIFPQEDVDSPNYSSGSVGTSSGFAIAFNDIETNADTFASFTKASNAGKYVSHKSF